MSKLVDVNRGDVQYKCRPKVLMTFFRESRDQWKQKCVEAKSRLKKSVNLVNWMRTSRDGWKARAKQLEAEVRQLREEQKTRVT